MKDTHTHTEVIMVFVMQINKWAKVYLIWVQFHRQLENICCLACKILPV